MWQPEQLIGFFGTPRGLGLATATTSAAFFPSRQDKSGKGENLM